MTLFIDYADGPSNGEREQQPGEHFPDSVLVTHQDRGYVYNRNGQVRDEGNGIKVMTYLHVDASGSTADDWARGRIVARETPDADRALYQIDDGGEMWWYSTRTPDDAMAAHVYLNYTRPRETPPDRLPAATSVDPATRLTFRLNAYRHIPVELPAAEWAARIDGFAATSCY